MEKIMKRTVWLIAFILVCGFSANSYAQDKLEFSGNCTYPTKPEIVNGNTATEAEMIASQKEMKDFLALSNEFLACLDKEENIVVKPNTTQDQKKAFKSLVNSAHNAAVDDMNAVAELFNSALRAYKGKNQ